MKLARLMIVTTLLAAPHAAAGDAGETSPVLSHKAELTALVEAWIDAEVSSDRKGLERILDEEFVSTFPSGKTVDRTAYIDFIVSQEIPPFTVTNDFIAVHGDTAVVIDISENGTTKFTWIAKRVHGQWKVIAQTFTSVKSP